MLSAESAQGGAPWVRGDPAFLPVIATRSCAAEQDMP
jgi:hypothetical protein